VRRPVLNDECASVSIPLTRAMSTDTAERARARTNFSPMASKEARLGHPAGTDSSKSGGGEPVVRNVGQATQGGQGGHRQVHVPSELKGKLILPLMSPKPFSGVEYVMPADVALSPARSTPALDVDCAATQRRRDQANQAGAVVATPGSRCVLRSAAFQFAFPTVPPLCREDSAQKQVLPSVSGGYLSPTAVPKGDSSGYVLPSGGQLTPTAMPRGDASGYVFPSSGQLTPTATPRGDASGYVLPTGNSLGQVLPSVSGGYLSPTAMPKGDTFGYVLPAGTSTGQYVLPVVSGAQTTPTGTPRGDASGYVLPTGTCAAQYVSQSVSGPGSGGPHAVCVEPSS